MEYYKYYMISQIQIDAVKKADLKAKIHEKNLKHLIIEKFFTNKIDFEYIDKIINFIKNKSYITTMVPIMPTKSYPHKNMFEIFMENPKLKNIFELLNDDSSLSFRKEVEDMLFAKAYKDCDPKLRPKYG